jgi:hypothetical protein
MASSASRKHRVELSGAQSLAVVGILHRVAGAGAEHAAGGSMPHWYRPVA